MRMNSRHRKTLERLFQKPAPANMRWADIEALFIALGAKMIEGAGSRVTFTLNDVQHTFHRPHPGKEATRPMARSARGFLENAGVQP
ncbi:MAG: type II toxin-antitoxin system HicA family toxin [Planctomycetota bacterium]